MKPRSFGPIMEYRIPADGQMLLTPGGAWYDWLVGYSQHTTTVEWNGNSASVVGPPGSPIWVYPSRGRLCQDLAFASTFQLRADGLLSDLHMHEWAYMVSRHAAKPAPGSPLDDPTGEKIGGHSYDPSSHNGRCPRCRGRAYVGLLSVECVEVSCEEWREPEPRVREVMIAGREGDWTSEPRRGERPVCERAYIADECYVHPTREGAIAAWKAGER
jgi:hypothetical protein